VAAEDSFKLVLVAGLGAAEALGVVELAAESAEDKAKWMAILDQTSRVLHPPGAPQAA
jgi:hypothetical protein